MPLLPPPVDHNAIRIAVVNAVMLATGLDQNHVVMSEPEVPNAPRPTVPYMALKAISVGVRYGDDVPELVAGTPSTYGYRGPRMMVFSFNAYGKTHEQAYDIMSLWQACLGMESTRNQLKAAGISVWLPGAVTDLSALQDTAYEGRAQMDCRFGVASYVQTDLGQIASVPIAAGVVGADVVSGTVSTAPLTVTFGG